MRMMQIDLWSRVCRDGDGGGAGGDTGSTGTSAAAGYGQAAASMGAAGVSGVGTGGAASSGPSSSSPAGGAQAAGGYDSSGGRGGSSSGGRGGGYSSGPSASSPAGGAQAAAGYSDGGRASSAGGYNGPSASSPAGGAQAAGGYAPGTGGGLGGFGPSGYGGPSPSSPGGGAQAAGGFAPGTGGRGDGTSGGFGPSSSSPAGGAQAAAGYTDGSRGGLAAASGYSSPAAGAQAAAGFSGPGSSRGTSAMAGYSQAGRGLAAASQLGIGTAQSQATKAVQDFLGMVRSAEAQKTDPYNGLVAGPKGMPTHANLTNMTIAEVQSLQSKMIGMGYKSTAVGAYQTIASTLSAAVSKMGINPNTTTFSPTVQDQIALSLADSRAAQAAKSATGLNATSFANALSKEWAGLENSTGVGSYDGVNSNSANTSFGTVSQAAQGMIDTGVVGGNSGRSGPAGTSAGGSGRGLGSVSAPAGFASTPANAPTPTANPSSSYSAIGQAAVFAADPTAAGRSLSTMSPAQAAAAAAGRNAPPSAFGAIGAPATVSTTTAPANTSTAGPSTSKAATPANTTPTTISPVTQTPTVLSPVKSFEDKYLAETPTRGRTIAATVVDTLLGLSPIGMFAGLANAGLAVAGQPSIGRSMVDSFMEGRTPTVDNAVSNYGGGNDLERVEAGKPSKGEQAESKTTAEAFIERYLLPQRDYETPEEKWGTSGAARLAA